MESVALLEDLYCNDSSFKTSTGILGSIYRTEEEDPSTYTKLRTRLYEFGKHKVASRYGMSFTEFMDLPTVICDELVHMSKYLEDSAQNELDEIVKGLDQ